MAASGGAHILFVLWPINDNVELPGDTGLTDHQRALRRFCAEHKLFFVDGIEVVRVLGPEVFLDGIHVNAAGNVAMTEAVAVRLDQLGWTVR